MFSLKFGMFANKRFYPNLGNAALAVTNTERKFSMQWQGAQRCRCGGPRFDQSMIRLNAYRACARMRNERFYMF